MLLGGVNGACLRVIIGKGGGGLKNSAARHAMLWFLMGAGEIVASLYVVTGGDEVGSRLLPILELE